MKMMKLRISIVLCIVLVNLVWSVGGQDSSVLSITLLNQEPDPARAGSTAELRFRVENIAEDQMSDVEIELVPSYPFTIVDGTTTKNGTGVQNLGTVYGYQSGKNYVPATFRVRIDKDALPGDYELKLRYRANKDGWDTGAVETFSVSVASKEFAQIIYVDRAKLEPGKESPLTFTITNIGNAPLQNMIFSWSEADGVILPVYSDDTKYIKYLEAGDSTQLQYTVIADVNAQPGLYKLDLSLRYESLSNATPALITTKAGVFVGGETDFEIAFSESTQGQTSLSVANTGNNPGLSVTVRIPDQEGFRVVGSNSAIIGNLDKGDYTLVSFQIASSAFSNFTGQRQRSTSENISRSRNMTGRLPNALEVVIDYTDTTGERRSVQKQVPIQFRSGTETGQFGRAAQTATTTWWQSTWFIGLVVGISILIIVWKRKPILHSIHEKTASK